MNRWSAAFLVALLVSCTSLRAQFSKPYITITPDGCQHAFVRVYDGVKADQGLSDVEVLWDPQGVYTGDSIVSDNVAFDGPEPSDYYGNTADSFNIKVIDPTKSAYLAVYAINHSGRSNLQEWRFAPIGLSVAGNGMFVNDSIGTATCADFTITNSDTAIQFNGLTQPRHGEFAISNISPASGTILKKGDKIKFQVCFTPKTIDTVYDEVDANVSCFAIPIALSGIGHSPLISASDVSFNGIDLGDTSCKSIRVWNKGNTTLSLSDTNSNSEFVVSGPFPMRIAPDTFRDIQVCFEPKGKYGERQLTINWVTNQPPEYAHGVKDYSNVFGIASPAGLHWDRTAAIYDPQHDTTLDLNVLTFTITNTANSAKVLDSIAIRGPQASTFVPYPSFPLHRTFAADQAISVSIQWQPAVPPPTTQRATAYLFSGGVARDSLLLTGLFPEMKVTEAPQTRFAIYPNPLTGNSLHVSLDDASEALLDVRNILGESVLSTQIHENESDITLPAFAPGVYFVCMTQRGVMQTKRLVIER